MYFYEPHRRNRLQPGKRITILLTLTALLLLAACQRAGELGTVPPAAETAPAVEARATTPVETTEALPADEALAPESLTFPALDLTLPVTPMGWDVVVVDDALTTEWQVPAESLGWHVNSAGAGAADNVIISGHQALGAALLAPVALGEVTPEQEILLRDAEERTFVYRVVDVSEPIPLAGAAEDEAAVLSDAMAATGDARLTLLTGWPEFTTTHRIVVVAEYVGQAVVQ
jgi:hypothetical protein